MTTRYFTVVIEREASGAFSAYVPGVPVYAQADTVTQAEEAVRTTLAHYLEEVPGAMPAAEQRVARVTARPHAAPDVQIVSAAAVVGAISSRAKTKASRANGKLGGRPKGSGGAGSGRPAKFVVGAMTLANQRAPADLRGRVGTIVKIGPGRNEYRVRFKGEKATGTLKSWWLDRA